MSNRLLAQYITAIEDIEGDSCPDDRKALARELHRVVFETVVSEAVDMVEYCGIDPFDAADWVAAKHNYDDFEAVLEQVRAEVGSCGGRSP